MTITISELIEPSKIDLILQFLRRENVSFTVQSADSIEEKQEKEAIRTRLHAKYVETNRWHKMSLEEKEDAALLETMLYNREKPDYHVHSPAETKTYLENLKAELYANSGY